MSQKFPFVFNASQTLSETPGDMDATWFVSQQRSSGESVGCYLRRFFLPGQGRMPSSSASPISSSSRRCRSCVPDGSSSSSNQISATVWSHCFRCLASSSRLPPRAQSPNQTSASISSGLPQAIPARRRAATDASGKGAEAEPKPWPHAKPWIARRIGLCLAQLRQRRMAHAPKSRSASLSPYLMRRQVLRDHQSRQD